MLEGLMALSLVLMGVYFVKSTDLPKDLKDRSAQHASEKSQIVTVKKKMVFPVVEKKNIAVKKISAVSLINLHNKAIDELTVKIANLEQELNTNNARNVEIQKEINAHLISLRILNDKIALLS